MAHPRVNRNPIRSGVQQQLREEVRPKWQVNWPDQAATAARARATGQQSAPRTGLAEGWKSANIYRQFGLHLGIPAILYSRRRNKSSLIDPFDALYYCRSERLTAAILIDSNIYLKLFGILRGQKLLASLEERRAHIFVSRQIVN